MLGGVVSKFGALIDMSGLSPSSTLSAGATPESISSIRSAADAERVCPASTSGVSCGVESTMADSLSPCGRGDRDRVSRTLRG